MRIVASAIWCAAICSAPSEPRTAVNVAKASISLPNWMPVGRPSATTSRSARPKGTSARARARDPARRVWRTSRTRRTTASIHSLVAVAYAPPRTPSAGSPR